VVAGKRAAWASPRGSKRNGGAACCLGDGSGVLLVSYTASTLLISSQRYFCGFYLHRFKRRHSFSGFFKISSLYSLIR
jgi:hypothetical protein